MIIEGGEERMLGRFISRYTMTARRNIFCSAVAHKCDDGAFPNKSARRREEGNLFPALGRQTGPREWWPQRAPW